VKIALLLLLLILSGVVFAENQSITLSAPLSITCNNESQCATAVNGSVVFFSGNDSQTTLSVPLTFSYEMNQTIVQNVTVLQNVTNITVETTNVTVTNCNVTPVAPVINISVDSLRDNIVNSLNGSLVGSCKSACGLSDSERSSLEDAVKAAQQNQFNDRVACQSQLNITNLQLQQLNETCTLGVDDLKQQLWTAYVLVFLALLVVFVAAVIIVKKSRTVPKASGTIGSLKFKGKGGAE